MLESNTKGAVAFENLQQDFGWPYCLFLEVIEGRRKGRSETKINLSSNASDSPTPAATLLESALSIVFFVRK